MRGTMCGVISQLGLFIPDNGLTLAESHEQPQALAAEEVRSKMQEQI